MEGFQGEDRHDPLPHIALLTTALKSAYRNTASLSSASHHDLETAVSVDVAGLREVCYRAKAAAFQVG